MPGQTYSSREMIAKLVSFPTVSRDSNLPLIDFVADYLASWGIESHRIFNEDGTKANLYASVGPDTEGGIVLSGHTDVVPVDGQEWTSDPFTVVERGGRLYGRGTADMKAFSAINLALVPYMLEAGIRRPVHFALSYDEEVGCLGAPSMIMDMAGRIPTPLGVIVGEPTEMRTVTAHKAIIGMTTHVRGYEVHSSLIDRGVSAVAVGARLVTWLDDRLRENIAGAAKEAIFDPPFTTIHCGRIEGGTAHNITAKDCWFFTDIRAVNGEDPADYVERYRRYIAETIEPEMKRINPSCGVTVDVGAQTPGLRPEEHGAAENFVRAITGDNGTHTVSYGTEGGQFQDGGFSTVVCGPGSIEQAHQPDEYIEVSQVEAGEAFIRRVIERLAA